jgi:4'-phosphopantetheinyl transferase
MSDLVYWTVTLDDQTPCVNFTIPFDAYLTPYELERLSKLRFPKRRAEWLHGRWTMKYLLRHSIPAYANLPPVQVQLKNEPEGMPFLEKASDGSRLPLYISISHREHRAFCALTDVPSFKVGIDLEWVESRPPSFLEDYFTTREFAAGLEHQGLERDIWFTLLWSLKEAVLKAVGKGLRLDTRNVEVIGVEDLAGALHDSSWRHADIHFENDPSVQWRLWWRYQDRFVYSIAVGFPVDAPAPELHEVSPTLE